MTASGETEPRFEFLVYPNPALSPQGFMLVMGLVAAASGAFGAGFFLLGAWPVTGFLGLDVLGLYIAFRWARRQCRQLEMIRVDREGLVLRRVDPGGRAHETRIEPYWASIKLVERHGNRGILTVTAQGRQIEIGRFLTVAEKRDLARALEDALRHLR
jgi:uncharacterized membrane protein